MIRIFLLGFMGTGKTTLGRALALDMNLSFCDLDQYIEQRYMKRIGQIFQEYGEAGFRRIESRLLREVGEFEDTVVSCGGATPLFDGNIDYMNAQGQTIWIETSEPVLFRRLKVAKMARPLIAGKTDEELRQYIADELARRSPVYEKAGYRYSGDRLESVEQVSESVRGVRALLGLN